ncbi:MAG: hypothetical protein ACRD3V_33410 [Vicinamibacteria bacterium]
MIRGFAALLLSALPLVARPAEREDCFPLEGLPPDLREWSESLLLRALDNEALYTFVSDLKPMSSFIEFRIPLDDLDLSEIEKTRRALQAWRCGDHFYADVRHFREPHGDRLYAEGAIWNRPLLERLVRERAAFFSKFGLTPSAHPMEVVMAVEYDETVARYQGYGYLYGYPDYAVEYFAEAETSRERTEERAERDFFSVPTYARPEGAYAWAVPKGHDENGADREILAKARAVLEEYRRRRERYIGEGKPGVVELLRDWYDDGSGRCDPGRVRASGPRGEMSRNAGEQLR